MEDDLIMNRLPLPKYFDGVEWKTELKPTRKCIPKYLHDDLPILKHIYIKQKFKEIGKVDCPKIQYFNKMIKNNRRSAHSSRKRHYTQQNKNQTKYQQLKQELQYALIIADSNSNIVDELLQKVMCYERENSSQMMNRNKNRRLSNPHSSTKYFNNTVDLVFKHRRKQQMMKTKSTSFVQKYPRTENVKLATKV